MEEEDDFRETFSNFSDREWRNIEEVSSANRILANIINDNIEFLTKERPRKVFNTRLFSHLCGQPPEAPKTANRTVQLQYKHELATYEAIKKKPYGFESMVFPLYKACTCLRDTIMIHRLLQYFEKVDGVPNDVKEKLEGRLAKFLRAADLTELVNEIAQNEQLVLAPELCVEPGFHEEQTQFVLAMLEDLERPEQTVVKFKTPPSSGKTSSTLILAKALPPNHTIIYSCYSEIVRTDLCKGFQACMIPFMVATNDCLSASKLCYDKKQICPMSNKPVEKKKLVDYLQNCLRHVDRMPKAIVADLHSTHTLLKHQVLQTMGKRLSTTPVVLLDEPCVAGYTDKYIALAGLADKIALMSATLDASFDHALEGRRQSTIESTRILGGPLLLSYDGQRILPHDLGTNKEAIRTSTHLIRFYQSPTLLLLAELPSDVDRKLLLTKEGIACLTLEHVPPREVDLPPAVDLPVAQLCGTRTFDGTTLLLTDRDFYKACVCPILQNVDSLRRRLKAKDDEPTWPLECSLNSVEHIDMFRTSNTPRMPITLSPDILNSSAVWAVESALSGAVPLTSRLDRAFRFAAHTLADSKRETYAVGSAELIFGTNLPLDAVLIDLSTPLNGFECIQAAGRAGRLGKSAHKTSSIYLTRLEHVRSMCA